MDNNQTQNAMSGFLGAVDGLRGLLIDGLKGDKLGSAPTGSIGVLGAIVGIDASIDKYNNSGKTAEDFARLALDLATNLPGTAGLLASDFSFTYDGTVALIQWANQKYAGGLTLGEVVYDWTHPPIDPHAKTATDAAKAVLPPRRDPLTFDLDGDGLETTAIAATNPILFDHDGDGVKNGTGWVKPDDGFLVRDVNGNGTIDNGRELFGDSTIKSNGQTATDGFDALADLDSNADGKIDSNDTQFNNLRIWRDLNQDGISVVAQSNWRLQSDDKITLKEF